MANLLAKFHEHLTRPGVKYDEEMSFCLLESDLKMSKSHTNVVSFDEMADRRYHVASNFAGQYIEMRMRRVHLSTRTEGIKVFSKRIRRCSVYGRKRYEHEKCGRKSF